MCLSVPICIVGALDQLTSTGPSGSDSPGVAEPQKEAPSSPMAACHLTSGLRHLWEEGRRKGRRGPIWCLLTATGGNRPSSSHVTDGETDSVPFSHLLRATQLERGIAEIQTHVRLAPIPRHCLRRPGRTLLAGVAVTPAVARPIKPRPGSGVSEAANPAPIPTHIPGRDGRSCVSTQDKGLSQEDPRAVATE